MLRRTARRLDAARRAFADPPHVPPGHFYSPILSPADRAAVADARERVDLTRPLPGIDLRTDQQWALMAELAPLYASMPWDASGAATEGLRYRYENQNYLYSDAIFYASVLRHVRPRRVIEVGSGFSSALLLDVNDLFLDGSVDITFIEPYPDVLRELVSARDLDGRLVEKGLQAVGLEAFDALSAGDILFIDSTHVARAGSDVNYLLFEILPRLAPGVLVHVHDIFFPFEYPAQWIRSGWAWNEAYAVRAFLQFNEAFEIVLFNTYLESTDRAWFETNMPLCLKNEGGSIWLRRI